MTDAEPTVATTDDPDVPTEPVTEPVTELPGALPGLAHPDVIRAVEAIVMVSAEPVDPVALAPLLDVTPEVVDELCGRLARTYEEAGAGFQLVKVAGGWRYQSHPDLAPYVERFVLEGQTARLSAAALETLAIVAYKQPISRAQIASIRGVDPDGTLRTLQARGYVDQIGRDPGPGQAMLWGTTALFLERLGLNSLADLPPLAEFVPGADVVEALEQGLRITPVRDVPDAPAPAPAPAVTAEAVAVDEVIVIVDEVIVIVDEVVVVDDEGVTVVENIVFVDVVSVDPGGPDAADTDPDGADDGAGA